MDQDKPKTHGERVRADSIRMPIEVSFPLFRYINYLAPDIDKGEITQKELRLIYDQYEEYGPKWSLIQQSVKRK